MLFKKSHGHEKPEKTEKLMQLRGPKEDTMTKFDVVSLNSF